MRPPALISSSSPLSQSLSPPEPETTCAEVRLRRWSWERVTERDELVGRMRAVSRFPQLSEGGWGQCGNRVGEPRRDGLFHNSDVDLGDTKG